MLSHANLIADAAGTAALLEAFTPGDRHISYLPLAHIYERNNLTMTLHLGGSVGFYSGNVQELLDDVMVRFAWARMGAHSRAWVAWACMGVRIGPSCRRCCCPNSLTLPSAPHHSKKRTRVRA